MQMLPADEPLNIRGEAEVQQLLHELGLTDWPAHEVEQGILIKSASHHDTHWLVFLCVVGDEDTDWFAFGFPKSRFSQELAEEVLAVTTAEFGVRGPFFSSKR